MSDPPSSQSLSNASAAISLPDGHKLYCWKVPNGSSVRIGETVALSVPRATTTTTAPAQHKRPTRRKRPAVAASASSTTNSNDKREESKKEDGDASAAPSVVPTKLPAALVSRLASAKTTSGVVRNTNSVNQVAVVAKKDGILRIFEHPSTVTTTNEGATTTVIGSIDDCLHPTVIEGRCVVCYTEVGDKHGNNGSNNGEKTSNSKNNSNSEPPKMSRMTVAGLTFTVSEAEGQRIAQEDAVRLQKKKKLSLVLDLDHTLVHATADARAREHVHTRDDVRSLVLPIALLNGQQKVWYHQHHFVKFRPHLKEFLQLAQSLYEFGVYTAGTRAYAEQITILLARHLVGASRDQMELEQLRHQVAHVERHYEIQQQQQQQQQDAHDKKPAAVAKESKQVNGELKQEESASEQKQAAQLKQDDSPSAAAAAVDNDKGTEEETAVQAGKKRKHVTFGDLPSKKTRTTTNEISREQVENLRAELAEAERLEREALELRQRLFGSRVVSRTDVGDLGRDVKSLQRIFPCGGSMAVVIDDREDVWANARDIKSTRPGEPPENLLLVRPYHWSLFLGFADVNNASGADLSGQDMSTTESELDNQLLSTKDVLQKLHQRYYSYEGPNRPTVPQILHTMRNEVLAGCEIVLSGLIELHKQNLSADLPRPSYIRYAENLGAKVLPAVTKSVTHVVAAQDGTDKVLAARRVKGCLIVKKSWLMECVWTVTRAKESSHLLGLAPLKNSSSSSSSALPRAQLLLEESKEMQPLADSKRDNSSSSSSDEDDDDLMSELRAEMDVEE